MCGCVLRVSGPYDQLRKATISAPFEFQEAIASIKRRELEGNAVRDRSSFNFTVSNADGNHVPLQIREVEAFLKEHKGELEDLLSTDGVDDACLDFGWDLPFDSVGQFNQFPASLLGICASLNIDIQVSVYHVSNERDEDDSS